MSFSAKQRSVWNYWSMPFPQVKNADSFPDWLLSITDRFSSESLAEISGMDSGMIAGVTITFDL